MRAIPTLRRISSLEPGVYINYGGSRGTLFAVPLLGRSGTLDGEAILFGSPDVAFREATIAPEQSFIIEDIAFEMPPLLEMGSGMGTLRPGCLAADGARVSIAARDAFEDLYWVDVSTGEISEPRSHRHYFRSWRMVVETSTGLWPVFAWSTPPE